MKKKIIMIAGIVMILAGIAIFLYPIINQAISANEQEKIMEEVKAQIMESIKKASEVAPTEDPESREFDYTDPNAREDGYFQQLELNYMPEATEEPSVLENDRLNGHKPYGIIEIKKIDLVYAVVEGVDSWNIGVAIGHFPASVGFGEEGNCSLAGHRGGTSGPYFRDLDELGVGDEVVCTNLDGEEFTYVVTGQMVVEPTDTYVVKSLGKAGKYLTLVTCTNHGTQRLVVRCELKEPETED
ncbi:MAG: class D sortase [Lachnospiraceae bacterium]|nr:class D sortase [Lachnospiraceae bacterium]